MTCLTVYASAEEYITFWKLQSECGDDTEAMVNAALEIAAADINAAIGAAGACDCTFADWTLNYLKKLNIIDAAVFDIALCVRPRLTDDQKRELFAWMERELDKIANGERELCAGETGSKFPSLDWADQSVTEFAAAQIIFNDALRNS